MLLSPSPACPAAPEARHAPQLPSALTRPSHLQRYDMLKQEAVQTERHMLRAFGFVVHVEHPHRFILNYCQMVLFDTAKHPERCARGLAGCCRR